MIEEPSEVDEKRRREVEVLSRILADFQDLDQEARMRVLQYVTAYFALPAPTLPRPSTTALDAGPGPFSEDRSISPKSFVMQKQPRTDVERVACLAYYLTHYRDTPHFKTLDISKLNTEAAQPKFSNATVAVDNATKTNYLVAATTGNKQLSGPGELFVLKLPDREAAKLAMDAARPRRKARKAGQGEKSPQSPAEGANK